MKQEYINKIMELGKGLSKEDRDEMFRELEISEPTGLRYLAGDIVKFDIADKLIEYMERKCNTSLSTNAIPSK